MNQLNAPLSYGRILAVASPIMVGVFVQFTMLITDSAFLNRVGTLDFNASGNAGMLYVTLTMFAMGISNGAQVLIARRDGELKLKEAGNVFRQSLLILCGLSVLFTILLLVGSHKFLPAIVKDAETGIKMQEFLDIRSWGFFFALPVMAFQGFYTGVARTRIIMYSTIITALLNILLDYLLIFGNYGFPELGLQGAAIATVIAEAAALLFVVIYMMVDKQAKPYSPFGNMRFNKSDSFELMRLSFPLMLQGIVSMGTWTIFFFFIEQLGPANLEVSQVIRIFYLIALIPVLGLGSATRTFVSHLIAEGKTHEVVPTVKRIILLNLIATVLFTFPNLFFPHLAVPFISTNPEILDTTANTLQIVTGAMFLLAASSPLNALIAGAGATQTAFRIELFSIAIYLFGAWLLTVKFPQPIVYVWCLEYIYFLLMFFACLVYIRKGKWKDIKI